MPELTKPTLNIYSALNLISASEEDAEKGTVVFFKKDVFSFGNKKEK